MANLQIETKNPMKNKDVIMIYEMTHVLDAMELVSRDTTPPNLEVYIVQTNLLHRL